MQFPIYDLHCDLLTYLIGKPERSPLDDCSRCSLKQMKEGNVKKQILAVFSETQPGSSQKGEKQFEHLEKLPNRFAYHLCHPFASYQVQDLVGLYYAIENASVFFEENEPLEIGFKRIEKICKKIGPPIYMSLTWNHENRFGGGNQTTIGLKRDGEELLNFINGKNIAIDLSHTSDFLADDILNCVDKKGLQMTPIASHSNFRSIINHPRNLPDLFAKEIIKRGGIIGLNFVRAFIGNQFLPDLKNHISHMKELNGLNQLCFGADFFYDLDPFTSLSSLKPFFHPFYENASCYPKIIEVITTTWGEEISKKIAYRNFENFLKKEYVRE